MNKCKVLHIRVILHPYLPYLTRILIVTELIISSQKYCHLMRREEKRRREDSLEKTQMLGKYEGKRRRGQQRMRWLYSVIEATSMKFDPTPGGSGRQEGLACSGPWGHKESDTT